MQTPLVSVIIPNYNHAKYLPQRIESVINQSYKNIEIIILDDCSTDNSIEIIQKYCELYPTIQFYLNQQNSGTTFKQWNKGIQIAKGEYIWLAESDDFAHSTELITELMNSLLQNSHVGVAYCQSIRIDENNQSNGSLLTYTKQFKPNIWEKDFVMEGISFIENYLFFMCAIPNASAVIFKKAVFEKVGGADETLRVSGDWFVWLKMLSTSAVAFIAMPHNSFRFHTNNARSSITEKKWIREDIVVLLKFQQFYKLLTPKFYVAFDFLIERLTIEFLCTNDSKLYHEIYQMAIQVMGDKNKVKQVFDQQATKESYVSACCEQIQHKNWYLGAKGLLKTGYQQKQLWHYVKSIVYWTLKR
jgi:glycosyltransferase involved in cell wall biosynthesis